MANKLETLSILMDERVKNVSPLLEQLFQFQDMLENKFIPSIERVQYERKYKLINEMRDMTTEMSFYLQAPYIIGKNVIGIIQPDVGMISKLKKSVKCPSVLNNSSYLCSDVPSIIYPDKDNEMIAALNVSDTILSIEKQEYLQIVDLENSDEIELGSLLHFIAIPSSEIDNNTVYIIIPQNIDKTQKYCKAIINSIDELIICGDNIGSNFINDFTNLKGIETLGFEPNDKLKKWAAYSGVKLKISDGIKQCALNGSVNNFEYKYAVENIIYEIGSFLADRKKLLRDSVGIINKDLLYKDSDTEAVLKDVQRENSAAIENIEEIYKDFKFVSDDLITMINDIETKVHSSFSEKCLFNHMDLSPVLIDLLIKMGNTFAQFPYSKSKELMRERVRAYESAGGDPAVSGVIFSDAIGESIENDYLERFRNFESTSEFVIKKMLDMSDILKLTYSENESLIYYIKDSMRPSDKRKLAEAYYFVDDKKDKAKELFTDAMELGDEIAGNQLMKLYKPTSDEITHIADFGNADACFYLANSDKNHFYKNTFKYLIIAAAKGNKSAIKALGNYYYGKYLRSNDITSRDMALNIFTAAYQEGSKDKQMLEKMANITNDKKDYKLTVEYCEKAQTPAALYLLGIIYENGHGCSANKKKAFNYYEASAEKGYSNAQEACERLNEEFQAKAKKHFVDDNADYSPSYNNGNYSIEKSGW